jgi:hypothetical protein
MNIDDIAKTARESILAGILSSISQAPTGGYAWFPGRNSAAQTTFDQQTVTAIFENRSLRHQLDEAQCAFKKLADQWKAETRALSSTKIIAMHPAYQKIMVMGKRALPFILNDLRRDENHWFWALSYIADENPVPPESRGKVHEMAGAWLDWGRKNGYV